MGGILGATRPLLERRMRRLVALHARFKFKPLGMAHCEGDEAGTWVVGYVLEATAGGEGAAGRKWTVLELCRREGSHGGDADASTSSSGSSGGGGEDGGGSSGRWLYFGPTRSFPQKHDSAALLEMIQEHDPESLGLGAGAGRGGGLQGRRKMYRQGERRIGLPQSDMGAAGLPDMGDGGEMEWGGGWYVDLTSAESMGAVAEAALAAASAGGGGEAGAQQRRKGRRRDGGGAERSRAAAAAVADMAAGYAAREAGDVFEMDAYLEALAQAGAPAGRQ
jgi:hypothetical protein